MTVGETHQLKHRLRAAALRRWTRIWSRTGRDRVAETFHRDLIAHTSNFAHTQWMGVRIWQNILDLWTIQESIVEARPSLLIETGTNRGGSALFYAHLMDLIGHGRLITIDIERLHQLDHPRIEFIHGSSTDPAVVDRVRSAAEEVDGAVMVILDGNHARDHVAQELELYGPLVTPGSWLLSQDGVIDELAIFANSRPGPLSANVDFLQRHPEFEHDQARTDRFLITHHPVGWLRRRG